MHRLYNYVYIVLFVHICLYISVFTTIVNSELFVLVTLPHKCTHVGIYI